MRQSFSKIVPIIYKTKLIDGNRGNVLVWDPFFRIYVEKYIQKNCNQLSLHVQNQEQ